MTFGSGGRRLRLCWLKLGEPQDALFGIVLVVNALIGIGQELRARRILDWLAVLSLPGCG